MVAATRELCFRDPSTLVQVRRRRRGGGESGLPVTERWGVTELSGTLRVRIHATRERQSMTKAGAIWAAEALAWELSPGEQDKEELVRVGKILDLRPASLRGRTVGMRLAETLLQVRTREGGTGPLRANAAQQAFERRRGRRNIVLKARQMGMTSWAAARLFLKTITQPGTLTLEVAHTQEAAEEIFRIVYRFLDGLPEELRAGPLKTSRANVRQIVFPEMDSQYRVVSAGDRNAGRGLTVQNLHCS